MKKWTKRAIWIGLGLALALLLARSFRTQPVLVDEVELGLTTLELKDWLLDRGVEVRHRYPVPLYQLPVFLALNNPQPLPLPMAEKVAGKFIGLPNRPDMADSEIQRVLDVLGEIPRPGRVGI